MPGSTDRAERRDRWRPPLSSRPTSASGKTGYKGNRPSAVVRFRRPSDRNRLDAAVRMWRANVGGCRDRSVSVFLGGGPLYLISVTRGRCDERPRLPSPVVRRSAPSTTASRSRPGTRQPATAVRHRPTGWAQRGLALPTLSRARPKRRRTAALRNEWTRARGCAEGRGWATARISTLGQGDARTTAVRVERKLAEAGGASTNSLGSYPSAPGCQGRDRPPRLVTELHLEACARTVCLHRSTRGSTISSRISTVRRINASREVGKQPGDSPTRGGRRSAAIEGR
jgi:hypothetical protein